MQKLTGELAEWLRRFALAVRSRDLEAGRRLFASETISFGTVCFRAHGLEELESRQWRAVWPNSKDFEFNYETAVVWRDINQAVVLADWSSTALDAPAGQKIRRGRSTLVLRNVAGQWQAVHSHFSISPSQHDPLLRRVSENAARLC